MSKFTKNLAIVAFLVLAGLTLANFVLAQGVDVGLNYGEQIGLNNTDPRIMAANVIRIVLGFLGVIAVGLIIYAGWLYMTAGGEEEKIEKAKKILINAIIGLIIILSSFAIATFVLNRMLAATNPSAISDEGSGGGATPGGGGIPEEGETPGGENEDVSCSDSDSACVANNTKCEDGYHCNTSCICEAGGGYEESCDSAPDSATCEADDGACSAYLTCDTGTCTCLGAPVIEWVSPMDESDTPNGKPGNMITIGGRYFGDEPGKVYFFDGKEAQFPGAPCTSNWRNDQIIVLVPAGAVNGPIRIERADGANDTTSNDRGPVINDFVKNDIARPGICKIDPTEGVMDSPINYYGFGLSGSVAYFGSASNNVLASNSTFNNNTQGKADVSDIRTGRTSTFVSNNGENSNYLGFKKNPEPYAGPKIISFEPASGAPGQYVTIHGSGFGAVKGSSEVYFSESPKIRANYDFPEICADSVWSDNQVIVKVPTGSSLMTSFITMEVVSGGKTYNISSNNLFTINSNPLTPSLCKIDPVMGPNNAPISLWGENFGEQADVSVKFYSNRNQSDIDSWSIEGGAQKIVTSVQPEAQTGPVQVAKGTLVSNSLNFNVGSCVQNADCASGVCCPFDSNEAGQCRTDLNNCYSNITGSVYEWEFSTGNSGSERGGCSDEQISCGASCCSSEIGCFDDLHNCCEEGNCPPDGEITCGDETCIAEECINGECPSSQCASGQTVCGLGCCDDGVACAADNQCENSPCSESEIQCVTECCATACVDGACSQADRPGETCFAEGAPSTCSVYPATCGANYSCMAFETDTCGTCCCDASTPQVNSNGLICAPDKSPCVGGDRGLFCGCENDQDCDATGSAGCGSDTCCRTRPSVSDIYPTADATAICRNTIITADFNQPMNVSSFSGNIIVVGDYGSSDCPTSASPLSFKTDIQNKNIFAGVYKKIAGVLKIISGAFKGDSALAGLPDPDNNYCAVAGTVKGVYNADKTTSITFSPNKPLDAIRTYYIIIKGDEELDSSKGVLNSWGIGMNGPNSATINGKLYSKAKIWSFRTGNDVCKLDSVRIDPASYLFQTSINDPGDDNAAALDSFDKIDDSDKFFTANAMSSGQIITSMSGSYSWNWEWSSTNPTVAEVSNSGMVTAQNVKDGETLIKAKATIAEDTISKTSTVGESKTGQSEVYVFLCANPWPPVVSGTWTPWKDSTLGMNCLPDTGDCKNTNYEFYYCRDQGASGPADDLPAILSGDTIIRGESSIQDILKEAYFFRE